MLILNYQYRIYPSIEQASRINSWLETLRGVYNYALRERKDWINSRRCAIDACSIDGEYILSAEAPYPDYYQQQNALTAAKQEFPHLKDVQSQVIKARGLSGIQTVCGRELSGAEFAQSRQDRVKQKCLGVSQGRPRYSLSA